MKFNINNYKGKYAMHCKDETEFDDFVNYLYDNGYDHLADVIPSTTILRQNYYGDNVFYFNDGTWSDIAYAKSRNVCILEWSTFISTDKEFTKADLKTGDVVLRRNGNVEIVNRDMEMFILADGWNDFDDIREDLTYMGDEQNDIIAVRRPQRKSECSFYAFVWNEGTLVYERKEPEEMTLEQVCKLLGKEIKIIK